MEKTDKKKRVAPFKDPVIRAKAHAAAKGKKRPNRKSRAQLVHEAKVEIVKDELIREGYLKEVRKHMPKVIKAHLKVASTPRASATQERKLLFEATGIKEDKKENIGETIGQVLAQLAQSS